MKSLPPELQALAEYPQFILWKLEGPDKDKVPISYKTLSKCDPHQPDNRTDAVNAFKVAEMFGDEYNVGFVFTKSDPFYFVDIDHCLVDGEWSTMAKTVMGMLPGAAVEVSQSGEGLHIFGKTTIVYDHAKKNKALGLELYTEKRFVALTGLNVIGSASVDSTLQLKAVIDQYYPPKEVTKGIAWTTAPCLEWIGTDNDTTLIKKARETGSVSDKFSGDSLKFEALWTRNVERLSELYPETNEKKARFYDESLADAALAQQLCFWTGNNCERILNIMNQSALVRDKWKRTDYLIRTILYATSLQQTFYTGGKRKERERVATTPTAIDGDEMFQLKFGYQFMDLTGQIEHFKGCVYVQALHKIFTPLGHLLKSEQFDIIYGGYVFQLEDNVSGKTTKKAWEAFTQSQGIKWEVVFNTCFKPKLPPCSIVIESDMKHINSYIPVKTKSIKGDASRFINHMNKLIPNTGDLAILMAYAAAIVQYKGVKFQWCPLIQGMEGNGKTLLTRCLMYCVGEKYTHMPMTNELGEKYNDWLFGKLFIGIEDVFVAEHKLEVMEILKPMISNDRLAKRAMQVGQVMDDNFANFVLNSNYKDGIRKHRNDRRFAMFFTAQQNEGDLKRDGMDGLYFPEIYKWLKEQDGYAIVNNYLTEYQIPDELNPATTMHRAPITTSTAEAIETSMGSIEQEILEAIEQGLPGFAGGWVSSMAIQRLLVAQHSSKAVPLKKRKAMMMSLGYDWHPGLHDGRVNVRLDVDQGKPRLYVKNGHLSINLTNSNDIIKAYVLAQNKATHPGTSASEAFK